MYGTQWIFSRLIPLQVISPLGRYRLIVRLYELQAVQQLYLIFDHLMKNACLNRQLAEQTDLNAKAMMETNTTS